jgi:hypothetical protein
MLDILRELENKGADRQSMENLLDSLCAQSSRAHICSRCGLEMIHLDGAFFLSDGERGWNISLPVCPHCEEDLEDLHRLSFRPTA